MTVHGTLLYCQGCGRHTVVKPGEFFKGPCGHCKAARFSSLPTMHVPLQWDEKDKRFLHSLRIKAD